MGASPTPADSTHCLRGQNKSSLKTSCKHMPNPRPRLHEVSYCGPWVITLQLGFSTAVTSRLVAGQLSLLAESMCGMQDQGSPAHALPTWSLSSFPVTSFLPSHLQHLKPLPFLNLNSTWVINSSIRMIKKGMGGMREVILQVLNYRPSGRWSWSRVSGLSLNYLKISPLSYCIVCTHLTFKFGKFKFRLPNSLRNSSILEKIKVETNQLDIKQEWETQSILISTSLWIFVFAVFSSCSSWTRRDNWKPTRQTASPNTHAFFP